MHVKNISENDAYQYKGIVIHDLPSEIGDLNRTPATRQPWYRAWRIEIFLLMVLIAWCVLYSIFN